MPSGQPPYLPGRARCVRLEPVATEAARIQRARGRLHLICGDLQTVHQEVHDLLGHLVAIAFAAAQFLRHGQEPGQPEQGLHDQFGIEVAVRPRCIVGFDDSLDLRERGLNAIPVVGLGVLGLAEQHDPQQWRDLLHGPAQVVDELLCLLLLQCGIRVEPRGRYTGKFDAGGNRVLQRLRHCCLEKLFLGREVAIQHRFVDARFCCEVARSSTGESRAREHGASSIESGSKIPAGAVVESGNLGGVPIETVTPSNARRDRVLLFLHGGGYASGSAAGYRAFGGTLAAAAGMRAVIADYRLAPEHPYPAAYDDAFAVYGALLEQAAAGEISQIVVADDSAGGGLTLALAQRVRDAGLPAPVALGLICPWLDLALDSAARRVKRQDPIIIPELVSEWTTFYVGNSDPTLPSISPIYGDLHSLPPIAMHSADLDPLSADADKLEGEFGRTPTTGLLTHRKYMNRWHDFHLQIGFIADADRAVAELGAQLRDPGRQRRDARRPENASSPERMDSDMNKYVNKVAVVTGAGSGIGRSLAVHLAERGAHVAISDVDEVGLTETARLCDVYRGRVHSASVNVAERAVVHVYAEAVAAE